MPGYLSNRYIKFNPPAEIAAVQSELDAFEASTASSISSIQSDIVAIQGDVEDLQLNIGV